MLRRPAVAVNTEGHLIQVFKERSIGDNGKVVSSTCIVSDSQIRLMQHWRHLKATCTIQLAVSCSELYFAAAVP